MTIKGTSSAGPAQSRLIRMIFYVGEGLMGGGILFGLVSIVAFLGAEFLTGTEVWLAGFLLVVFLAIALRNGWAIVLANRYQLARSDHPRLVAYRE